MRSYKRIGLSERENISICMQKEFSISAIAKLCGRNKSTISRELRRGKDEGGRYCALSSHARYLEGLSRNKPLLANAELKELVVEYLKVRRWSPAVISAMIKRSSELGFRISYETIYKFIYSTEGIALGLPNYLYVKKKKRGYRLQRSGKKDTITGLIPISMRPEFINNRSEIGHFEGDLLIISASKGVNIISVIERKSRHCFLSLNRNKSSGSIISKIDNKLNKYGKEFKSITFDRGKEFAFHHRLPAETYFCNPHSPWQKGAVEKLNAKIRSLLPRNSSVKYINQDYLDWIQNIINNTPLKVLDYLTPAQSFAQQLNPVALDP